LEEAVHRLLHIGSCNPRENHHRSNLNMHALFNLALSIRQPLLGVTGFHAQCGSY